jgi:subtilisin family serine protease
MVKNRKNSPEFTIDNGTVIPVLIEIQVEKAPGKLLMGIVIDTAQRIQSPGFKLDESFSPVPVRPSKKVAPPKSRKQSFVIRGEVPKDKLENLRSRPNILKVWKDSLIEPFSCPIPPCDCSFGNPAIGDLNSVAAYLGVDEIWSHGIMGDGIVIGIVDGGINAIGRPQKMGETSLIDRVIGGYPDDWGTTSDPGGLGHWNGHGNMTATDALGMSPQAQIYDIRISGPGYLSKAYKGVEWAINQHKSDGTPHILSNSWGLYENDDDYGIDPDHIFTQKVVEAIEEGIIVLFAAGNCGETCPSPNCKSNGPGNSIWGANGHPLVITVGAVNQNEELVGYSSQGPAALDPNKPDFCSITHFAGYFPNLDSSWTSDTGTSAATPIAAGVVALLKQFDLSLNQDQVKDVLSSTAKNIGPVGWDQHSGHGIIQGKSALYKLYRNKIKPKLDNIKAKSKVSDMLFNPKAVKDQVMIKGAADRINIKEPIDITEVGTSKSIYAPLIKNMIYIKGSAQQPTFGNMSPTVETQQADGYTDAPFILATPHHAEFWTRNVGKPPEIDKSYDPQHEIAEEIKQLTEQLEKLKERYRQLSSRKL